MKFNAKMYWGKMLWYFIKGLLQSAYIKGNNIFASEFLTFIRANIYTKAKQIRFLENIFKKKEIKSKCRNLKVTYHCIPSKCFNFSLYTYICTFGTQVFFFVSALNAQENKCTLLLYKQFFS